MGKFVLVKVFVRSIEAVKKKYCSRKKEAFSGFLVKQCRYLLTITKVVTCIYKGSGI